MLKQLQAWKVSILIMALFGAIFLFSPKSSNATSGCCSWHGGVSYCDTSVGTYVCNDGSYSPSCGCAYIPPKPICVKPTVGKNATWNFKANNCNQDVSFSWDKGVLDEFYSIQISKSPGADPGPRSDTSKTNFIFENIKPGKWYVNVKAGRSCGWSDVFYWTVDVSDVIPDIEFKEKVISEDERQLQYAVSCADKIEITPGIGTLKENSGSITIHPQQNSDYKLTATNKKQTNYSLLSVKYPLPAPKENNQADAKESTTSQGDSSGEWVWLIVILLIGGFVWLMNKLSTKNKSTN